MSESSSVLAHHGLFHGKIPGFTPRLAQQEMANAVEDALAYKGRLVVESGTGTGKTFAYLVPILLSGRRTIISTGTKHLQEQIFNRDLPVVSDTLGITVNAVLLKGRSNYLCRHRLSMVNQQSDLIGKEDHNEYAIINDWSTKTRSGDISEVAEIGEDLPVWSQVTSTVDNCLGSRCTEYAKCFVVKARQRAMEADVVVVNHHLYFSDLSIKSGGFGELLPDHEAIVFDEAHSISEIASHFFGFSVSSFQISELIKDTLAAEKTEKSAVKFSESVTMLEKCLGQFSRGIPGGKTSPEILGSLESHGLQETVSGLMTALDTFLAALVLAAPAGEALSRCHERCLDIQSRVFDWWENRDSNAVCWLEWDRTWFRMNMTPLNVASYFSKYTSNPEISWIFTSATLAVGDDFSSFCGEIGLLDAETKRWDSPYDYEQNTLLYLPQKMPDPRDDGYAEALVDLILKVTNASEGRAFCLFTSHAMLEKVKLLSRDSIGWPLMVQGDAPRRVLIEQFMNTDNGVLFGTSSFWEGVDVKGDALSCVIIDKLPFASPSDPVLASKLRRCEEHGESPFMRIQIPDAVITLKQGAGRLIRSESDKGVLVLCDPRIRSKSYGSLFLKSLPNMPRTNSFEDVQNFFSKLDSR